MTLKAYKYRVYPTKNEQKSFFQHFGVKRFVFNTALEMKTRHYNQYGKGLSKRAIQDQFVALKSAYGFEWLKEVNSQSILAALDNVHTAFKNFFNGHNRFPKYKSRKCGWQSYQCPQHVQVDFEKNQIKIPKIGWVKAKVHREFDGKIKTCTISKNPAGKLHISVLVDVNSELPVKPAISPDTTKGFDLGLTDFLIGEDGSRVSNPRHLKQSLPRLAIEQKKLARKQKGSRGREKQKKIVATLHNKITNQRNDFLHKTSIRLLRDNQAETIAMEDLNVKGMILNKKLSRHIADVAWSRFVEFVTYKADWLGKNLIFCGRWLPSSKQCDCGHKKNKLTLADRVWTCAVCHRTHDRDVLAARNIKRFALELADTAGSVVNVKSSLATVPVSAGVVAKDIGFFSQYGSLDAPSIAVDSV